VVQVRLVGDEPEVSRPVEAMRDEVVDPVTVGEAAAWRAEGHGDERVEVPCAELHGVEQHEFLDGMWLGRTGTEVRRRRCEKAVCAVMSVDKCAQEPLVDAEVEAVVLVHVTVEDQAFYERTPLEHGVVPLPLLGPVVT
jgi:hypothetical protein